MVIEASFPFWLECQLGILDFRTRWLFCKGRRAREDVIRDQRKASSNCWPLGMYNLWREGRWDVQGPFEIFPLPFIVKVSRSEIFHEGKNQWGSRASLVKREKPVASQGSQLVHRKLSSTSVKEPVQMRN